MKSFNLHNLKKLSFKIISTTLLIFLGLNISFAQTDVKIGTNVGNKNASAVLELESTTKGFLMPRMSSAQMAAISNSAVGLQIYNTTDSCIYVNRGITGWYSTCGGFNAWSTFGNTGINPLTNFLGTTDVQPLIVKTNGVERLRFDATGNINQTGAGAVNLTGFVTANAGATITGPVAGGGTVNINTVGTNTTNIGTAVSTTNLNGANLFIPALPSGSLTTDAILAVNRATGKADTLNINGLVANSITANNGITKTTVGGVVNIALGGALISPTTVSTDAVNTLALFGLTHGNAATDSILVATTGSSILKKVSISDVSASSVTASNGLNKTTANDLQLGGALTKNTSVDQGTFSLTINGTGTGATNIGNASSANTVLGTTTINNSGTAATTIGNASSAVTINGTTGVTGVTSINTGASATATNIGNAASTTTINGTSLNVTSLSSGASTDSLISVNPATGKINRLSFANVVLNGFTANNGLTKTSVGYVANVALGGTLTTNTTIDQSTNSLTFSNGVHNINATGTGATNIGNASSAISINGTTGVTGVTSINTGASATATNIGNAASTTTINGTSLIVPSLPAGGLTTDALVSVNRATGKVDTLNINGLVTNSITANNGLTLTPVVGVANVQLGGTLLKATAVAQAGFDMNFSGGNVAIGQTTSPNSTLQVTGSMGVSYQKVTSSYSLLSSDYIVLANATSGALTITLPPATATLTGRIYTIGKTDESTNIVTFSPALQLTESTTVSSINFAIKYRVVCDGSKWWIYNE